MPHRLRQQLHEFLHDYRKRVFELEHDAKEVEQKHQRANRFVEEVLDQKFHYRLHEKLDQNRAETMQLIHHYCVEAILPPVVNKFAERIIMLEKRHQLTLEFVERVLESLAKEIDKPVDAISSDGTGS